MRTYEIPKEGDPRLCFMDFVLKFDEHGMIAEDNVARCPNFCRFYQLFDFELLDESETAEEEREASETLRRFLKATWHGNGGAHSAELMGLTLA